MNNEDICRLSATQLAMAVRSKEISAVEVLTAVANRVERINPTLKAICIPTIESARTAAEAVDKKVMQGEDPGALAGVPVTIKDLLYQKGERATFGSKLYEDFVCDEDCPPAERVREAGGLLIGRTNSPEFGTKGVTENLVFGTTRNPWNLERTPGGSSGGASAAVASGLGPIAIGTDGGGSIRIPASFCGLVGLKPSFGRVPNYPATAVDSLRHTGPLTRTVSDTALALNVFSGPHDRDPHSLPPAGVNYLDEIERGIQGIRIAYSPDLGWGSVQPDVATLCEKAALKFADAGAHVEQIDVRWNNPHQVWHVLFHGGIAGAMSEAFHERGELLGSGLRSIIKEGLQLGPAEISAALLGRAAFWQEARLLFQEHDLLITPTLARTPFQLGRDEPEPLPGAPPTERWSPFTFPFNLTGQPAISVPCGYNGEDLPVGLQIVGRRFDDALVLRAARVYEQLRPWADRWPEL